MLTPGPGIESGSRRGWAASRRPRTTGGGADSSSLFFDASFHCRRLKRRLSPRPPTFSAFYSLHACPFEQIERKGSKAGSKAGGKGETPSAWGVLTARVGSRPHRQGREPSSAASPPPRRCSCSPRAPRSGGGSQGHRLRRSGGGPYLPPCLPLHFSVPGGVVQ